MLSPRDDLQELDELQEDDASKQDEPNAETIIGDTPDDTVALKANTRGKSLLGLESRPLCHGRWGKVALAPLTRHDRDGRFMPLMRRRSCAGGEIRDADLLPLCSRKRTLYSRLLL